MGVQPWLRVINPQYKRGQEKKMSERRKIEINDLLEKHKMLLLKIASRGGYYVILFIYQLNNHFL